jgi:hypothetical protein
MERKTLWIFEIVLFLLIITLNIYMGSYILMNNYPLDFIISNNKIINISLIVLFVINSSFIIFRNRFEDEELNNEFPESTPQ